MLLASPDDADAVCAMHSLEGGADGADGGADGVWAEVWPSAVALADELFLRPQLVSGKRCLELGAGLGLAGLAAALAGAERVLLSDRESRATLCILDSASANGLKPAQVAVASLDWDSTQPTGLEASIDVLLLADVLYQRDSVAALARLVASLLSATGVVLLADTALRPGKEGIREAFLSALLAQGGRCLEVAERKQVTVPMAAPSQDINQGLMHDVELCILAPCDERQPPGATT